MGKRVAQKVKSAPSSARRTSSIIFGLFAIILVGGPAALHFAFGMGFSPVLTSSMRPFADPGDLLISMPANASTLALGDVILANNNDSGAPFAHRIVEIGAQGALVRLTTKGDANPTAEQAPLLASPNAKIGREVLIVRGFGTPLVYINSEQGRQASISLLVLANVALIAFFLQRRPKQAVLSGVKRHKNSAHKATG